jgi:hypothetical protein
MALGGATADNLIMRTALQDEETRARVLLHFVVCYHRETEGRFQTPETVHNEVTPKAIDTFNQIKRAIATLETEGLLEKRLSTERGFGKLPYGTWRLDADAYVRSLCPPLPAEGPRLRPSGLAARLTAV